MREKKKVRKKEEKKERKEGRKRHRKKEDKEIIINHSWFPNLPDTSMPLGKLVIFS